MAQIKATAAPADHLDPLSHLPEREARSIWDETEGKFWPKFRSERQSELDSTEERYQRSCAQLNDELAALNQDYDQLKVAQERLAQELAEIESRVTVVRNARDEVANNLEDLHGRHRMHRQDLYERQHRMLVQMTNFFRAQRGDDPLPDSEIGADDFHQAKDAKPSERLADILNADGHVIGGLRRIPAWNHWVASILELPVRRPIIIRRTRPFTAEALESIYVSADSKGIKWLSFMIQATGVAQSKPCKSCANGAGPFMECISIGSDLFHKCGNCEWNRQGCNGSSGEAIPKPPLPPIKNFNSSQSSLTGVDGHANGFHRGPSTAASPRTPNPVLNGSSTANPARNGSARTNGYLSTALQPPHRFSNGAHFMSPNEVLKRTLPPIQAIQGTDRSMHRHIAQAGEVIALAADHRTPIDDRNGVEHHQPRLPIIEDRAAPSTHEKAHGPTRNGLLMPKLPSILPADPEHKNAYGAAFTPANGIRSQHPMHETAAAAAGRPSGHSPQLGDDGAACGEELEITRANLVLENDGRIYTKPPCMYGVPLEKIDENHWYWDPKWKSVRSIIEPQLRSWKAKHQVAMVAEAQGKKTGSSKYQIGRQVNRGKKILEFLETGSISPYQLLGKQYVQMGKGGITSYDTLFRLSESLTELEKFNLDVSPVDWLRHRLYELMTEQGHSFNLGRTIHDFYHDPKLTSLRYKKGYKNIGRPSGSRWSGHKANPDTTSPGPSTLKKRKGTHSLEATPLASPKISRSSEWSPVGAHMSVAAGGRLVDAEPQGSPPHADGEQSRKRARTGSPSPGRPPPGKGQPDESSLNVAPPGQASPGKLSSADEFDVDSISDTDSWSGAPIGKFDWRVYQVRTRLFTSSKSVTQYLTWLPDIRCLEHQVLKETSPVQWGRHRKPINFDIRLDDATEVGWNIELLRVHLSLSPASDPPVKKDGRPRGAVMASFKRERTLRRFLAFCRLQGLSLVEKSA